MPFTATPAVPTSGVTSNEFQLFSSFKQNMDLLIGQSREEGYRSILTGQITVVPVGTLNAQQLRITGRSYNLTNIGAVPSQEDFNALARNVNELIADMTRVRNIVDTLIKQLKG